MDEAITELITSYIELNSSSIIELDHEPSPLEFMRFVAKNTPFVVRGGAADWKAVRTWSVDYLKETLANEQVNVAVTPFGYVPPFTYESTNSPPLFPPATPTPPPPSPPTPPPSSSPNPTKNSNPSPTSSTTSSTKNTTPRPAPRKFDTPRPVRPPPLPPTPPLTPLPTRKQQPPPRIPPPRPVRPHLHPLRAHRPLPPLPHPLLPNQPLLVIPPPPRRHKPLGRQLPLHDRSAPRRLRKHLRPNPRTKNLCPPAAGVSAVRE